MPYNLRRFTYREMMECRAAIRALFDEDPPTLAAAADRIVRFLYDNFVDDDERRACALVRTFKTHPYDQLDDELKAFARNIARDTQSLADVRCLVLIATAGDQHAWNDRHASAGHKCIPLVSEKMVEEAPMISQLIQQIGLKISMVLRPDPALMLDNQLTNYNVFYVPRAKGSPYIVAQKDFVERYGIESVIGFGGLAGGGDLLATIMFSKVRISTEVAELFRVVGLNTRIALLPMLRKPLFGDAS